MVTSWRGSTSNERNHGQGLLQVVGGQSGCHRRPDQGRVCPYTSSNLREDNTFEKLRIDLGGTRQIESVYRACHSPFINLGCLEKYTILPPSAGNKHVAPLQVPENGAQVPSYVAAFVGVVRARLFWLYDSQLQAWLFSILNALN